MPNIEIKARYFDLKKAKKIALSNRAQPIGILRQCDTYFCSPRGRLKLREIKGQRTAWLIPYFKKHSKRHPIKSDYQLIEIQDPKNLKSLLGKIFGIEAVVAKVREVFLLDNVRVHLDQIKNIGSFLEFEAVFSKDTKENRRKETQKVRKWMRVFGIRQKDLVGQGYVELMEKPH